MKKIIALVLILSIGLNILLIVNSKYFKQVKKEYSSPKITNNDPIAYYANSTEIHYLSSLINQTQVKNKVRELPDDLIIKPGKYNFYGRIYELRKPGLYRFMMPPIANEQRIIFKKGDPPEVLLSSLAWIDTHGNHDDLMPLKKLKAMARNRKLYLTCCPMSAFAHSILKKESIKSRLVHTSTLDKLNDYNNGHCMLDVYFPTTGEWVVFDLDNKVYFSHNEKRLSFLNFLKYVKSGNYTIHPIANDVKADISRFNSPSGYRYDFFMEGLIADLKDWYRRVAQFGGVKINGKYYFTTTNMKKKNYILTHYGVYNYLPPRQFYQLLNKSQ